MNTQEDKYKLIFGFNNKSPLFARVAHDLLNKGEFSEAQKILETGLKLFPEYSTAYFINGLCCAELGEITKANEMIEKGAELIDNIDSLNFYLKKVKEISKSKNIELPEQENISVSESNSDEGKTEIDDLEILAKQLENAKLNVDLSNDSEFINEEDSEPQDENTGKPLVSETLAKIYFSQGNYKEALNLYQNLISIQPEREQFYQTQINKIKKLLG